MQCFFKEVKADTKESKVTVTILQDENIDQCKNEELTYKFFNQSKRNNDELLPKMKERNDSNSLLLGLIIIVLNSLSYYKIR